MEAYKRISLGLVFLLLSCQSEVRSDKSQIKEQVERETIPLEIDSDRSNSSLPRSIKISMKLYNPQDLKVKAGDKVKAGQVIGDRSIDRNKLLYQKSQLERELLNLSIDSLYVPIMPIGNLPTPNYQLEETNISLAENRLNDARLKVSDRLDKISKLRSLKSNNKIDLDKIIQHEQSLLANLEAKVREAAIKVDLAKARLAKAKQDRRYQEYLHQLELYKRSVNLSYQKLELAKQFDKLTYQASQLKSQIQQLEIQISQLAEVKSPYDGTIKKVKWAGQSDNVINVVVTLAVQDISETSSLSQ
ncbi:MAG: hypothetical protein QNJ38_10770 [Prochloraceae cyanobacterium]|nr:hypothetical protein [Prochloraceae cyanobacterium]